MSWSRQHLKSVIIHRAYIINCIYCIMYIKELNLKPGTKFVHLFVLPRKIKRIRMNSSLATSVTTLSPDVFFISFLPVVCGDLCMGLTR